MPPFRVISINLRVEVCEAVNARVGQFCKSNLHDRGWAEIFELLSQSLLPLLLRVEEVEYRCRLRFGLLLDVHHLRIAQPTLTRGLSELERELGAPLFERRPKGMIATQLGTRPRETSASYWSGH